MCLDTLFYKLWVSEKVSKMRAATILGEIVRLQQCNKNPLKYVHAISKYGNIFAMPDSSTQETFFQDLQETKAGRIKFCSIFQLEMRNIRWPWNNTCQDIFREI